MTDLIIDSVFEYLKDGQWHNVYDIDLHLPHETLKIMAVVDFIAQYGIAEVKRDEDGWITEVRLIESTVKWYAKLKGG